MTWAGFYLLCFLVGLVLSVFALLSGTVHLPHGHFHLGHSHGGGMKGGAWGIGITSEGNVWVPSFGGGSMVKYSPTGSILSPGDGYTNGGLNHPQGVAVDQKGNIWIANNYGPESAPGQGNVVVYPGV